MDSNNKTINSELRPCALSVMMNGITEDNCERITTLLQSIVESQYYGMFNDTDFCFFLTAMLLVELKSPTLLMLKNYVVNKYLYYLLLKTDRTDKAASKGWIIKKEIETNLTTNELELVLYNINVLTNEKVELSRIPIINYGTMSDKELDSIFTDILDLNKTTALTEDDL